MSLPIIQTIQNNINSLNSSKLDIKNAVNTDYDFIANEQIESYPSLIKQGIAHYKNRVPHATKEGTDLSFNAVPLKFENMTIKGNTSQASTTGKNKLPPTLGSITISGITYTTNDDGSLTINGTASSQSNKYFVGASNVYEDMHLTPGEYILSGLDNQDDTVIRFYCVKKDINDNTTIYYQSSEPVPITVNEGDTFRIFVRVLNGQTINNVTMYPQLELSSTATNYEPYTGGQPSPNPDYPQPIHVVTGNNSISVGNTDYPINLGSLELCKIGNYQDYIYKENGNWYKYGAIGKVVFDGNESGNWAISTSGGLTRFASPAIENSSSETSRSRILSNYFRYINSGASVGGGFIYARQFFLYPNQDITNQTELKAWLSTHNTSVYYPVVTPTSTQITDSTLIAQLEALDKAKGVDGTTIITIDSDDLKPILNFTAYLKEVE